jgi:hypothetical protein
LHLPSPSLYLLPSGLLLCSAFWCRSVCYSHKWTLYVSLHTHLNNTKHHNSKVSCRILPRDLM